MNHDCILLNFLRFISQNIFFVIFVFISLTLYYSVQLKNTFDFRCDGKKRKKNETKLMHTTVKRIIRLEICWPCFFFLVEFLRCVLRSNESNESDFSGNLVLFSFVIRLHTAHCVSKANNFCINFCALFYSSFCHFVFKYLQYTLFFCLISCVNFQTYFLYFNFIRINRENNIYSIQN